MKPSAPKPRPGPPAMPLKTKVNSQGEIPSAARIESMRVAYKTPDVVRQMDLQTMRTLPENKIDVYQPQTPRTSHTPAKTYAPPKPDTSALKKRKPEQSASSPRPPTIAVPPKKPVVDSKVESRRDNSRSPTTPRNQPTKNGPQSRPKDNAGRLALEATGVTSATDRPTPVAKKGPSMFESGSSGSQRCAPPEDTFPNLQKFVADEDFLREGQNGEESLRELPAPPSPAPKPEDKENSFCEIASRQEVSLGNLQTDFLDSFRALPPSSPVSPTHQQTLSGLNGTQISFEKKGGPGPSSAPEPAASLLDSLDKLSELQKENSKALANFFLLGSEIIRDPDEERIEVILNKRMDRKPSSRQWKDDFGVDPSTTGTVGPDNPFFRNDLAETDTFSLKKRSPNSSVETPKRPSDFTDPRNFETFRNQPALEVSAFRIFCRPSVPPKAHVVAHTNSFTQSKQRYASTQFEELLLSSNQEAKKQLRDSQREADTQGTSGQTLTHPASTSSLELCCTNCGAAMRRQTDLPLGCKPSEDVLDSNNSSARYLLGSVAGGKRANPLQLSNDECRLSPGLDSLPRSFFNKTNSGGVGVVSGTLRNSKGLPEPPEPRSAKNPSSDLYLSGLQSPEESPLRGVVSIFKKIVVFNSKWERVKESLFLGSPDLAVRAAACLPGGPQGRLSWASLADFIHRRQIVIPKQQVARLLFYVQSCVAGRDAQLAAVSNFAFFNFLATPKFIYSSDDAPAPPFPQDPARPEGEFSREELGLLADLLRVVAHKIDYFALSFKGLSPEFVQRMFAGLARGGQVAGREDLLAAIATPEAQIKVQDVCFILDEFQAPASGISWPCFRDYFDKKIWRL